MRISVDSDDPGFSPLAAGTGLKVFLGGIEISHVVTADEERRELVRLVTDERGQLRLNAERDGAERETLRGDVRIEVPAGHPAHRFGWRPVLQAA